MTPEDKVKLKAENKEKYGLTPQYIDYLQLPKACNVKVYQIDKIINGKKKLTTAEKIEHLIDIKQSLHKKLEVIRNGGTIKEFDYLSPQQFEARTIKGLGTEIIAEEKREEVKTSSIDEDEEEQNDKKPNPK